LGKFNLIVSTYRFREEEAQDEILKMLEIFGDPEAESEITEVKGLILARTSLEPLVVIDDLKELVASEPWQLRYILRVLPVQVIVPTRLDDISQAARDLAPKIGNDTFRVTVEKRHNSLSSKQVIDAITGQISNKVNLKDPGRVILVQILGGVTGLSILRPNQIFSSVVEKRR
jgi:tRNA acetyltransferase TAN1